MITTAGYGDLAPKSVMGRLTCLISCLVGVAAFSLFIVSLNSGQELDS